MQWLLLLVLAVLSGLGDSHGFLYASKIWKNDTLNVLALLKSISGFAFGIGIYFYMIRLMQQLKIYSTEIQTIVWFTATIIIVAIVSGDFFKWKLIDKSIAVVVFLGLTWLIVRVGK